MKDYYLEEALTWTGLYIDEATGTCVTSPYGPVDCASALRQHSEVEVPPELVPGTFLGAQDDAGVCEGRYGGGGASRMGGRGEHGRVGPGQWGIGFRCSSGTQRYEAP